jgi:maltooligosyltrehalose trehalohydrolase
MHRKYPIGAEIAAGAGVHFRVWAPRRKKVEVILDSGAVFPLEAESGGYFAGLANAGAGALYRFRLDGGDAFPDPASRFQPQGPHGPSQVVDPAGFVWHDAGWQGRELADQVISEIHIGTFTKEGTWNAARRELPELARAGITTIEVMPVSDFPGRFGWGYDGVGLFAPVRIYGEPDDFRTFVDDAHRFGLGVILDVVYNHLGPDGNYLKQFSEDYFSKRHCTDWGEAINFDGGNSGAVREWVITNAAYWADEYHLDGLRLDATQAIMDDSPDHILAALTRSMRAAAPGRKVIVVAENEKQVCKLARPAEQGGYGLDGLWNDDFHHTARVALTGHNEAYYSGYSGAPPELLAAVKFGYLYQGQYYSWQKHPRGTPAWGLRRDQFINYIQNHDQIANSGRGERVHQLASPGCLRAMTALLLLAPGTPLLFQGQEFGASPPFLYFADHEAGLAKLVRDGRTQFLAQFPSLAQPEMAAHLADPADISTFERCKLDFGERVSHAGIYLLHQDLLRLRRDDAVFRRPARLEGAVLGPNAFMLRFFGEKGDDRLLLVNLGLELRLHIAPEPLLAPPEDRRWDLLWSSEDPGYGGGGTGPPEADDGWHIPGHAALAMRPVEREGEDG